MGMVGINEEDLLVITVEGEVMVRYYGLYTNASIIRHLELMSVAEKLPPVHSLEQAVLMAAEESEEYE